MQLHHQDTSPALPILLLNSTPIRLSGYYCYKEMPVFAARIALYRAKVISYIGHRTTVQWITQHLRVNCELWRGDAEQMLGQLAVVVRPVFRAKRSGVETHIQIDDPNACNVGFLLRARPPRSNLLSVMSASQKTP
jgi:hypothetical protein